MKLFRSLRVFFSPVAFIRLIRSATSIRKYPTMSTRSIDLQALRMALLRQLSSSGDAQFVVGRVVTPSYFASSAFNFYFFLFRLFRSYRNNIEFNTRLHDSIKLLFICLGDKCCFTNISLTGNFVRMNYEISRFLFALCDFMRQSRFLHVACDSYNYRSRHRAVINERGII